MAQFAIRYSCTTHPDRGAMNYLNYRRRSYYHNLWSTSSLDPANEGLDWVAPFKALLRRMQDGESEPYLMAFEFLRQPGVDTTCNRVVRGDE